MGRRPPRDRKRFFPNAVTIDNCYATGNVTGTWNINDSNNNNYFNGTGLGGLVGNGNNVNINNSFATGNVTLANQRIRTFDLPI